MNTEKIDLKKGIDRLARVYCWPNVPLINGKDKDYFDALCEFVLFKVFILTPFFKSMLSYLFKHTADLYRQLSTTLPDKTPTLSYKEAYLFMRILGVNKVMQILEQIPCPSNVYNWIIRSLEEEKYDLFFSALDKADFTKTMQVLWEMRYVLLGEKGDWNTVEPSIPHLTLLPFFPRWINNDDYYKQYFELFEGSDDDKFTDERVIEIVHGRLRKKRIHNRIPSPTDSLDYEEENKKELETLFEKSLFKYQWKDLLTESIDSKESPTKNNWVNTEYIEGLARLILTHNVIIHKEQIMEKYGIDSSDVYNAFRNSDVYIYEDGDIKDLGRYILYYLGEMQNVYEIVKDIIPEYKKNTIQQLLYQYPPKNKSDIIADISTTNHKEGEKLFVTVLNSKLKGNTSEEKSAELLRCLTSLYEKLTNNEGKNLIDTATPKDLFIYRFSGKGKTYLPTAKIKWRGKNVLLGYIIRCLLSDNKYAPEDMGVTADFFESRSGNKINLASAKQVPVNDYERERNNLNTNFVEAVELLRRCGFINVEYTSKRR